MFEGIFVSIACFLLKTKENIIWHFSDAALVRFVTQSQTGTEPAPVGSFTNDESRINIHDTLDSALTQHSRG